MTSATILGPGERLGPFTLEQRLAMGGMAEIWSARTNADPPLVALKVLQPHLTGNRAFEAMFLDEVNIALRLRHENIVRVYDGRAERGHFFLVMDLVPGLDLRRILVRLSGLRGWIPAPVALSVGQCMVRGLAYVHLRRDDRGRPLDIVHRDISPHNVMLDLRGGVRLLDFGIARARERYARTQPGVVKGKSGYMAPEQAVGAELDQRADIFSTGIVLWELLAMKRLFGGANDAQAMNQVVEAQVPPLMDINPAVPPAAAELIHRMLARSPRDRPQTMGEVESALTRVLVRTYPPDSYCAHRRAVWLKGIMEPTTDRPGTQPLAASSGTEEEPTEPH